MMSTYFNHASPLAFSGSWSTGIEQFSCFSPASPMRPPQLPRSWPSGTATSESQCPMNGRIFSYSSSAWAAAFVAPTASASARKAPARAMRRAPVTRPSPCLLDWGSTRTPTETHHLAVLECHDACCHSRPTFAAGRIAGHLDLLADELFNFPAFAFRVDRAGSRGDAPLHGLAG